MPQVPLRPLLESRLIRSLEVRNAGLRWPVPRDLPARLDGARVVTASGDGTARIWEPSSGRELAILRGHTDRVYRAEFAPDGTRVVTASQDGTARIHYVLLDTIITQAQKRILRTPPELFCDERNRFKEVTVPLELYQARDISDHER